MTAPADNHQDMHFSIRYVSRYSYDAEVVDNVNALRVRPATNARQRVDEFSVRLTPDVRLHRHDDYFGTEVVEFEVTRPHRELTIDVRARVSTSDQPDPTDTSWEALQAAGYRNAAGEFLLQQDDAPGHRLLGELHQEMDAAPTPLAAVMLAADLIPARFEYRRGATYVDSPLSDLLDGGAGVCQDFTHLGLHLLRHRGIAARYVSGYLYTTNGHTAGGAPLSTPHADAGAGEQRAGEQRAGEAGHGEARAGRYAQSVEVDTHAWVEALLPREDGEPVWVGVDPTNRGLAGERHVKIGHGRHYADVPPIKGVYRGLASATLEARVTMTRDDGSDPVAAARG